MLQAMAAGQTRFRGRVFYSYLASFALILSIPILLSVVVFQRASTIIGTEIERVSTVLEVQTRKYLDSVASDVSQLAQLVINNPYLVSLALRAGSPGDDEFYAAYHVVADARTYRAISSAIIDFYVYLPSIDIVVTPEGFHSTTTYHRSWLSHLGVDLDDWRQSFSGIDVTHYRSGAHLYPAAAAASTPVVEIVTPILLTASVSDPRGWVVVQVRESLLASPFAETDWEDSGVFVVHGPGTGIIASSDRSIAERVLAAEAVGIQDLAERELIQSGDDVFVPLGFPSRTSSLYYLMLMPIDSYTSQLTALRLFAAIAFLVAGVVGAVVVFATARARYRPIRDLVDLVSRAGDSVVTLHSDEFRLITDALESTLAEQKTMRSEATRHQAIVRERMLRQLLIGATPDQESAREELRRYGVDLSAGWMWMVLMEPIPPPDGSATIADYLEAVRAVEPVQGVAIVLDTGGMIGALLVDSRSLDQCIPSAFAAAARARVVGASGGECAVGLSATHATAELLPTLYREAQTALEYRLVRGSSVPIRFEDVTTGSHAYFYPIEAETKLVNAVVSGDDAGARRIVQEVFERNFAGDALSIEMARCLMFDLISTMVKALNSIEPIEQDAEFWNSVSPVRRLTRCRSLEELRIIFDDVIDRVCSHVRASRTPHAAQLLQAIDAYIELNLADANMGPDSIGTALERSGAYIARFFREHRGVGLSAYVKQRRIEAAKTRLGETDTPVQDIAAALGFSRASAFVRAFKELEGIPPGEFRESYRCGNRDMNRAI